MLEQKQLNDLKERLSQLDASYATTTTSEAIKVTYSEPYEYTKIDSDVLIKYIPQNVPVDGDDCQFNLTMLSIDGKPQYVVTYDRISDGWTCCSFTGDTLLEVLYETLVGIDEL